MANEPLNLDPDLLFELFDVANRLRRVTSKLTATQNRRATAALYEKLVPDITALKRHATGTGRVVPVKKP